MLRKKDIGENKEWGLENKGQTEELPEDGEVEHVECWAENLQGGWGREGNQFPFTTCGKLCLLQAAQVKKKKTTQNLLSVLMRDLKLQFDCL